MFKKKNSKAILAVSVFVIVAVLGGIIISILSDSSDVQTEANVSTTVSTTASTTALTTEPTALTTTTTIKPTTTTTTAKPTTTENNEEEISTQRYTTTQVYNPDREAYLASIKDTKKLIAFTFDDGPSSESTPKLLDNLDKYNARVTFFVVGERVSKYSSVLKRAHNMGNEIGSHTFSHKNLTKLSDNELKNEVEKTNSEIKKVIGVNPSLMRPPYGSYNDSVKEIAGVPIVTWNIDTLDWKNKNKDKVCKNILDNAHDGAIVLMHDLYGSTVDGALMAMDKLQHEGYAFVTVSELAYLKCVTLKPGKVYFSIQ